MQILDHFFNKTNSNMIIFNRLLNKFKTIEKQQNIPKIIINPQKNPIGMTYW